ncbi:MAG: ABC transporter permease, partial [Gammaproteobacteria bacterium]
MKADLISALETTVQDLRYALRVLLKNPGFTSVVVLSLALGIGANTAIFSLIDAVMLRILPVAEPEQLLLVGRSRGNSTFYGFTHSQFRLLREHHKSFTDLAAYSPVRLNVSVDGSLEPTSEGQLVTGSYFPVLGVGAVAGRTIGVDDDRAPMAHPVAMISYGYWKRRFGLDASAVGRTIALCGTPFTIIGVTPAEFFGLEVGTAPDFFVPVMMQPAVMPASENLLENPIIMSTWLRTFGRLRPGVHAARAAAELEALHHQDPALDKSGRPMWQSEKLVLTPAGRGLSELRRQFSQPLFILMAVVGVVLVIACANVANLLLARAAARQTEFALRLALGAGRWRLMRQLLVESVLLAILGGIFGVLLAYWCTQLLISFMSVGRTPIVMDLRPDLRILAFTSIISVLTGILFGFAPAWRASRVDLTPALKGQSGRVSSGRPGLGPGKILVVSQVALSLVLFIGACLFVRSLQKLNGQDGGFRRESVLVVRVEPKGSDQRNIAGTSARLNRTYKDLLQRVESIPGVRSASLAHFTPTSRVGFSSPVRLVSGEEVGVPRLMV